MDQHTFEKRAISSKKYTYLQYSVASSLPKTSFFSISNTQEVRELFPNGASELHSHQFYSIFWFRSGEGTHIVDFDEYNIEKDSIFFLSPKHLHTFRNLKDNNGIAIAFTEDFLLHLGTELLNCIKAKLFYPIHGVSHCTLQENAKRKIEHYVKLLQEESASNTKDTLLQSKFLASALSLFLIDIIRLGDWEEADKLDVNSDPHRTYWHFVDLVEKNFTKHHSVKFYIETMRISQTTLAAHTQQYAKISPLKLINDRIILEAKRMIRYSDLRIKEIAFDLGFKDDSYFAKLFKRNVGMSPVEFRQKEK